MKIRNEGNLDRFLRIARRRRRRQPGIGRSANGLGLGGPYPAGRRVRWHLPGLFAARRQHLWH